MSIRVLVFFRFIFFLCFLVFLMLFSFPSMSFYVFLCFLIFFCLSMYSCFFYSSLCLCLLLFFLRFSCLLLCLSLFLSISVSFSFLVLFLRFFFVFLYFFLFSLALCSCHFFPFSMCFYVFRSVSVFFVFVFLAFVCFYVFLCFLVFLYHLTVFHVFLYCVVPYSCLSLFSCLYSVLSIFFKFSVFLFFCVCFLCLCVSVFMSFLCSSFPFFFFLPIIFHSVSVCSFPITANLFFPVSFRLRLTRRVGQAPRFVVLKYFSIVPTLTDSGLFVLLFTSESVSVFQITACQRCSAPLLAAHSTSGRTWEMTEASERKIRKVKLFIDYNTYRGIRLNYHKRDEYEILRILKTMKENFINTLNNPDFGVV